MVIGALVLVVAAAVLSLATSGGSSDETDKSVVRIYGKAIGASADDWDVIGAEALEWANGVCSTAPADFAETWSNAIPGRDEAIDVAEVRCPERVRDFADDQFDP